MKRLTSLFASFAFVALAGCGSGGTQATETTSPQPTVTSAVTASANESNESPSESPSSSPVQTGSPEPAASPTATVSYADLSGTFDASKILDLARLGTFDSTSGAFKPNEIVTRRVFVRWLFKANNAIWSADESKQIRPATSGDDSAFKDVPSSDPDFPYIQGLQAAGISVGFPDKTFRPDSPLTREQALAVKSQLDKGGVDPADIRDPRQALYELPNWKDKNQIGIEYVPAINTELFSDNAHIDNVGRTFGAISALKPKQPMTRAQAAIMMWKIGDHTMHSDVSRTATSPAATPTP